MRRHPRENPYHQQWLLLLPDFFISLFIFLILLASAPRPSFAETLAHPPSTSAKPLVISAIGE